MRQVISFLVLSVLLQKGAEAQQPSLNLAKTNTSQTSTETGAQKPRKSTQQTPKRSVEAQSSTQKGGTTPATDTVGKLPKTLVRFLTMPVFCLPQPNYAESKGRNSGVSSSVDCADDQVRLPTANTAELATALSDHQFLLTPIGSDKLAIFCVKPQCADGKSGCTRSNEKTACAEAEADRYAQTIGDLAKPAWYYSEEVVVPRSSAALIASQISALNIAGIYGEASGDDRVVLKSQTPPFRKDVERLKSRIKNLGWARETDSPSMQLFHLNAPTVVKNLAPARDTGTGTNSKDASSSEAQLKAGAESKGSAAGSTPTVQVTVNTGNPPTKDISNSDDSSGTSKADMKSTDGGSGTSIAIKPVKKGDKKQSDDGKPGKPALTTQAVNDMLVFSNSDGSDTGIAERRRLITMLDLPRPEVLLNVWSFQASSSDPVRVKEESEEVRQTVTKHNEALQNAIQYGWTYLSRHENDPDFFDKDFHDYITDRFVLCADCDINAEQNNPEIAEKRKHIGICPENTYCLGYTHTFEPLRPTLTSIILTMIAAKNPLKVGLTTILCMSGYSSPEKYPKKYENECFPGRDIVNNAIATPLRDEDSGKTEADKVKGANDKERRFLRVTSSDKKDIDALADCVFKQDVKVGRSPHFDCELEDRLELYDLFHVGDPESLQLSCFEAQMAETLLSLDDFTTFKGSDLHKLSRLDIQKFLEDNQQKWEAHNASFSSPKIGQLRAAIADFLFNYKMAQEYPHDFVPYDLAQSAQELNAELNPLILAFNRDVAAFTQHLEAELSCSYPNKKSHVFWKQDDTFLNDGMVSVRGISGVENIVDTLTQSYFDATNPPTLTDLAKSVQDAEKNLPGVISGNLTAHEASLLLGAVNSVKPAKAKIGRQLLVDITPHALAGASAAELDVKLNAQESADPTRYEADKTNEDPLSRVARHNTTTKVRVDSLKLFEVSTFSAMVQRPKSRFPLVPPFFEVPYFGSFLGVPLSGAKEYHRSTAIVSAVIVPTAADLAYGIDFTGDRVCETPYPDSPGKSQIYQCHKAATWGDLQRAPIRNFHKAKVQCLATLGKKPYPQVTDPQHQPQHQCSQDNLHFSTVPPIE
jgi:hypothetical protein